MAFGQKEIGRGFDVLFGKLLGSEQRRKRFLLFRPLVQVGGTIFAVELMTLKMLFFLFMT